MKVAIKINRYNLNSFKRFLNGSKYSDKFKIIQEGNTFILSGSKEVLDSALVLIESAYSVEVSWEDSYETA